MHCAAGTPCLSSPLQHQASMSCPLHPGHMQQQILHLRQCSSALQQSVSLVQQRQHAQTICRAATRDAEQQQSQAALSTELQTWQQQQQQNQEQPRYRPRPLRPQQQQQHQQQHQQQRYPSSSLPSSPAAAAGAVVAWCGSAAERRAHLAALVKAASSVDKLAAVWVHCRAAAGTAELAVLFNRLAAVCEPRLMSVKGWNNAKTLLRELLIASEDKMGLMAGPEFVYIIAALAKLKASTDQAWLNRWLAMSRHKLAGLTPAQLAMCARALCRLDMQLGDVKGCIAFPAWMHNFLAALRPRLAAASAYDITKILKCLADLGYKPTRQTLTEIADAVETKLSSLDSINLTMLMGAFSALKYEPEPSFMRAFYAEVYEKLPLFDDQDLAQALCAFSQMRRLMTDGFLTGFLQEVAAKLPTFSTPALASVLLALGQIGYKPGKEWTQQVATHLQDRLWRSNVHWIATATWGLAMCGHTPEPSFVEMMLAGSAVKLHKMDAGDAVMLVQALAKFGYQPPQGSSVQQLWLKWCERYCFALDTFGLQPRQVVAVLQGFAELNVTPDPQAVDHLVLQLVAGGFQHAPVRDIPHLLDVLIKADYQPGPEFVKSYAQCIRLVSTTLSADQLSGSMRCLAVQRFTPSVPWLVHILAVIHSRVADFTPKQAAQMLWATCKICKRMPRKQSKFPSEKWVADFSRQYWDMIPQGVLNAESLGEGAWGSVMMGYRPGDAEWQAWEAAAAKLAWKLPFGPGRHAIEAYRRARRKVPAQLLDHFQNEIDGWKVKHEAEVAAAQAARQEAAMQLAQQQRRAAAAAQAIAQHQAASQQMLEQVQQALNESPQQQQPGGAAAPVAVFKFVKGMKGRTKRGTKAVNHTQAERLLLQQQPPSSSSGSYSNSSSSVEAAVLVGSL